MNISDLKKEAKGLFKNHYGNSTLILIIYLLIILITQQLDSILKTKEIISAIATIIMEFGIATFFLNIVRKNSSSWQDLFSAFKYKTWDIILAGILRNIFIALWSLLLIIPGIIKVYSYSMIWFIMNDNHSITPMEALRESEAIMKGHKWELFKLQFSFIGWILLSILTFGILLIYVFPYIMTTTTLFYEKIKEIPQDQN